MKVNWKEFRGKLMVQGKTIKAWCSEVGLDRDRFTNIQQGRVKPTHEEQMLIEIVLGEIK